MAIIAMLVSSLVFTYNKAKSQARQTDCKSNLRQFGVAVLIYRSDHGSLNPDWLSNLYPDYVDSKQLFICRSDPNHGTGISYPSELQTLGSWSSATPVCDNDLNSGATAVHPRNTAIHACSYFYEFSAASTPWKTLSPPLSSRSIPGEPFVLYCDFKNAQLQYGDSSDGCMPYSTSRMPIIRCYCHIHEGHIPGYANSDAMSFGRITDEKITLNVAYAGNVYVGPLWWEGTIQPGDTNNVAH